MNWEFDICRKNRIILLKILDSFSTEDLNKIPDGFSNNLIWNIAHVIVTQQLLTYNLSGLPMKVTGELVEKYRKGTKVERDESQTEIEEIKSLVMSSLDELEKDYNNGVFNSFKPYITSTNSNIKSIEEAITFNLFHEGIHLGYILAMKKGI